MKSFVKFRKLTDADALVKYPEGMAGDNDSLTDLGSAEITGMGEVMIPGHGYVLCALGLKGTPIYFFGGDGEWDRAPDVQYQEI